MRPNANGLQPFQEISVTQAVNSSATTTSRATPKRRVGKARSAAECLTLEQLPNVGPAMAGDLRALGLSHPQALQGRDPYQLYRALERHTGLRQDPCVLDTFMAVVDFMGGAPPHPWWHYTAERKRLHGQALA